MKLLIYRNNEIVNEISEGVEANLNKQLIAFYVTKSSTFKRVYFRYKSSLELEHILFQGSDFSYKFVDILL